jgi:hypothetical protein
MSDFVSVRSTEVDHRKSLFIALLITVVGAGLIFSLSRSLLIDQDFVGSIYENGVPRALGGFFLLAFPYIHQQLAGKRHRNLSHLPDGAAPFNAYTLPWYIVLIYSVLIAFAIAGLSLFLIWLAGIITGFFLTEAGSILNLVLLFITFYYLGSWIGSRSVRSPYLTAAGIVLGYTILEFLVTMVLNVDSPLRGILGLVIVLILFFVAALIGTRAGKRRRLSNYVHFLLTALPEQDRQAVVDDMYREVKQRVSGKYEKNP